MKGVGARLRCVLTVILEPHTHALPEPIVLNLLALGFAGRLNLVRAPVRLSVGTLRWDDVAQSWRQAWEDVAKVGSGIRSVLEECGLAFDCTDK
jgi:hypothetical protein